MKFILFGISGSFYFSSRFRPWIKYTWMFANFSVILVTLIFGNFGYFISSSTNTLTLRDLIYMFVTTNVAILAIFIAPLTTFYFKTNIEDILTLEEEPFFKNIQIDSAEIDKSKGKVILMLTLQLLTFSFYIFSRPLFFMYSDDTNSLNNLEYYLFAHLWLGQVQTPTQYYFIFAIQSVAVSISLIYVCVSPIMILIIGHEFHVAFLKLQRFLKDASQLANLNINSTSGKMMHLETQLALGPGIDSMKNNIEELMIRIETAIQVHQSLRRKMKIIQPYIELLFSIVLVATFLDQSLFVFMICSTDMSSFILFKELLAIIEINLFVVTYCYAGKLMDDAVCTSPAG